MSAGGGGRTPPVSPSRGSRAASQSVNATALSYAGGGGGQKFRTRYLTQELMEKVAGVQVLGTVRAFELKLPQGEHIRRIEKLELMPSLVRLCLQHQKLSKIENLSCLAGTLQHLSLRDNEIDRLDGLPTLPALTHLDLSRNAIDALPATLAKTIPLVKELHLSDNQVKTLSKIQPVRHLRGLEVLDMSDNEVCASAHYRSYMVWATPTAHLLDGAAVSAEERRDASERWQHEEVLSKDRSIRDLMSKLDEAETGQSSLTSAVAEKDTEIKLTQRHVESLKKEFAAKTQECTKMTVLSDKRGQEIDHLLTELVLVKSVLGELLLELEAMDMDYIVPDYARTALVQPSTILQQVTRHGAEGADHSELTMRVAKLEDTITRKHRAAFETPGSRIVASERKAAVSVAATATAATATSPLAVSEPPLLTPEQSGNIIHKAEARVRELERELKEKQDARHRAASCDACAGMRAESSGLRAELDNVRRRMREAEEATQDAVRDVTTRAEQLAAENERLLAEMNIMAEELTRSPPAPQAQAAAAATPPAVSDEELAALQGACTLEKASHVATQQRLCAAVAAGEAKAAEALDLRLEADGLRDAAARAADEARHLLREAQAGEEEARAAHAACGRRLDEAEAERAELRARCRAREEEAEEGHRRIAGLQLGGEEREAALVRDAGKLREALVGVREAGAAREAELQAELETAGHLATHRSHAAEEGRREAERARDELEMELQALHEELRLMHGTNEALQRAKGEQESSLSEAVLEQETRLQNARAEQEELQGRVGELHEEVEALAEENRRLMEEVRTLRTEASEAAQRRRHSGDEAEARVRAAESAAADAADEAAVVEAEGRRALERRAEELQEEAEDAAEENRCLNDEVRTLRADVAAAAAAAARGGGDSEATAARLREEVEGQRAQLRSLGDEVAILRQENADLMALGEDRGQSASPTFPARGGGGGGGGGSGSNSGGEEEEEEEKAMRVRRHTALEEENASLRGRLLEAERAAEALQQEVAALLAQQQETVGGRSSGLGDASPVLDLTGGLCSDAAAARETAAEIAAAGLRQTVAALQAEVASLKEKSPLVSTRSVTRRLEWGASPPLGGDDAAREELEAELGRARNEAVALRSSEGIHRNRCAILAREVQELKGSEAALGDEVRRLRARNDELARANGQLEEGGLVLGLQAGYSEQKAAAAVAAAASAAATPGGVRRGGGGGDEQVALLEEELLRSEARVADLAREGRNAEANLADMVSAQVSAASTSCALRRELLGLQEALAGARGSADARLAEQRAALTAASDALRRERDALRAQLEQARAELDVLAAAAASPSQLTPSATSAVAAAAAASCCEAAVGPARAAVEALARRVQAQRVAATAAAASGGGAGTPPTPALPLKQLSSNSDASSLGAGKRAVRDAAAGTVAVVGAQKPCCTAAQMVCDAAAAGLEAELRVLSGEAPASTREARRRGGSSPSGQLDRDVAQKEAEIARLRRELERAAAKAESAAAAREKTKQYASKSIAAEGEVERLADLVSSHEIELASLRGELEHKTQLAGRVGELTAAASALRAENAELKGDAARLEERLLRANSEGAALASSLDISQQKLRHAEADLTIREREHETEKEFLTIDLANLKKRGDLLERRAASAAASATSAGAGGAEAQQEARELRAAKAALEGQLAASTESLRDTSARLDALQARCLADGAGGAGGSSSSGGSGDAASTQRYAALWEEKEAAEKAAYDERRRHAQAEAALQLEASRAREAAAACERREAAERRAGDAGALRARLRAASEVGDRSEAVAAAAAASAASEALQRRVEQAQLLQAAAEEEAEELRGCVAVLETQAAALQARAAAAESGQVAVAREADQEAARETAALRRRVAELEAKVAELEAENASLLAELRAAKLDRRVAEEKHKVQVQELEAALGKMHLIAMSQENTSAPASLRSMTPNAPLEQVRFHYFCYQQLQHPPCSTRQHSHSHVGARQSSTAGAGGGQPSGGGAPGGEAEELGGLVQRVLSRSAGIPDVRHSTPPKRPTPLREGGRSVIGSPDGDFPTLFNVVSHPQAPADETPLVCRVTWQPPPPISVTFPHAYPQPAEGSFDINVLASRPPVADMMSARGVGRDRRTSRSDVPPPATASSRQHARPSSRGPRARPSPHSGTGGPAGSGGGGASRPVAAAASAAGPAFADDGDSEHILVPRRYLESVYQNTSLSRKMWQRKERAAPERVSWPSAPRF